MKTSVTLAAVLLMAANPVFAPTAFAQDEAPATIADADTQGLADALGEIGREGSSSPSAPLEAPQETGPFPSNQVTPQPFVSPNGGEEGLRASVKSLQQALTELQQLQLQTKQAHWNVSGTLFRSLHKLLQEHYEGLSQYADMCAERLLAIGASSDGRATTIVETSGVPEFPGGFIDDAQVIRWFTLAYKQTAEEVRGGIYATEENDPQTSNILQEIEGALAKYQWQMRAFVQNTPTDPNEGADLDDGQPIGLPQADAPIQIDPSAN